MKWMRRSELAVLILSLAFGFAGTCLYAEYAGLPDPVRTEQAAWWGGLYPEYCLPGAMEAETAPEHPEAAEAGAEDAEKALEAFGEERGEAAPVRIRFKYLTFFNEAFE